MLLTHAMVEQMSIAVSSSCLKSSGNEMVRAMIMLNDLTAWGTLTDTAWETGTWYTFALVGDGTIVDAYFSEQGSVDPLGDDAYLTSWDAEALDTRSPGFPGLTASSRAGLEVQFDNFQVIKDGAVLFEDTFDKATSVSEWSVY